MTTRRLGQVVFDSIIADSREDFEDLLTTDNFNLINERNESGETLLMIACERGLIHHIEFLLKNGADKDLRCARNSSAIERALLTCNLPILKLLEKYRARGLIVEALQRSNDYILAAIATGEINLVSFLYFRRADICVDGHNRMSLISHLVIIGNFEMIIGIRSALPATADGIRDINEPDHFKRTPLMHACTIPGRYDIARYLIEECGADADYRPDGSADDDSDDDERSKLPANLNEHSIVEAVCALDVDLVDIVRLLIKHEVTMYEGCRAVEYAVGHGRCIQVNLLLTYDAYDANINNYLEQAAIMNNIPLINILNTHQATRARGAHW